ncbi:hypothetical protein Nepgr_016043 [Nepenthes gracilis]|uniref:Uncharacterized protein n=1 Tax=Nepenthes gracilis TaxID=150966 RepID=A0AAD3XQX9_NEPGR|nr:hypothetical protein Nepgr_016043 [Nepenthes gracilis]
MADQGFVSVGNTTARKISGDLIVRFFSDESPRACTAMYFRSFDSGKQSPAFDQIVDRINWRVIVAGTRSSCLFRQDFRPLSCTESTNW